MRLAAAGTRIGDVDFCPTPEGASAYQRAVDGDPSASTCLAPYPFGATLDGVDAAALGIDFETGYLVSCAFEVNRPLAVGQPVRVTVDITDVRARSGAGGAVATVLVEFWDAAEVVGRQRYVFADGALVVPGVQG